MSQDYKSLNTYPIIKNFSAVQTWTEVILPSKAYKLTVGCEQHDIYVSFTGVDGGSIVGVDKLFIKSGGYVELVRGRGSNQHNSIYIATKSSSSGEITVILEE